MQQRDQANKKPRLVETSEASRRRKRIKKAARENKRAEEEFPVLKEPYPFLAEIIPDVVWITDMNLRTVYISPSIKSLRGFTQEEAISQSIEEVLTPASCQLVQGTLAQELAKLRKGDKNVTISRTLELEMKCKDNSTVWTELIAALFHDNKGCPAGFYGIARDITMRKRTQDELQIYKERLEEKVRERTTETYRVNEQLREEIAAGSRAREELREKNEFLEGIFDNAAEGIFVLDNKGKYIKMNPALNNIVGRTAEEMLGKQAGTFTVEEEREKSIKSFRKALHGERLRFNAQVMVRDGSRRVLNVSLSPMTWSGKPHVFGVITDITEQKNNEEKLKRLTEELRELSLVDELTDLYNRRGFLTIAQHQYKLAKRIKKEIYLFFIDLDKMKWINDTLGHQEGDRALIEAANILRETFRESDVIARLGGDEFAVMLIELPGFNADTMIRRLLDKVQDFNSKGKHKFRLSLSFGLAIYDSKHRLSLNGLLHRADKLMYAQKKGKSTLEYLRKAL